MIWLTSDLHLFHNKEFVYKSRGFETVEEMNEKIISNINSMCGPDDDLYILGDLMLYGSRENGLFLGLQLLKQLRPKIHLIQGNHDTINKLEAIAQLPNMVEITGGKFLNYKNYSLFLSHYPMLTRNSDYFKPLRNKVINLYGHTHTKDPMEIFALDTLNYNVGLDAHNCFPVDLPTVIEEIKLEHDKLKALLYT